MSVTWSKKFDPSPLVNRLEECRTVDGAGRQTYEGFTHSECVALIHHALVFPKEIPETEGRRLVNQASSTLREGPPLNPQIFLSAVNRLTVQYFSTPTQPFALMTTISLSPRADVSHFSQRGVRVHFHPRFPRRFLIEREKISERAHQTLFADQPTGYLGVLARLSARSHYEAADSALDTIDLQRGIWNWYFNRRHFTRMSFGSQKPVNNIVLGPIHTLHHPRGQLATETFWFEQIYRAPAKLFDLRRDHDNMAKFTIAVRKALRRSKYRDDLEKAIITYARALDDCDLQTSFLKLWVVLELLTSTGKDETYASTLKRASFVFMERKYFIQVLRILTDYRNRAVHASISTGKIETYLYQLKNVVEVLLEFHLFNRFRFKSLEHASQFLSLPTDKDALAARVKITEYALEYRGYRPRTRTMR